MKRLLSIIIISLFLVSVCVLEEILVKSTLKDLNQKSTQIYTYADSLTNLNEVELLNYVNDLNAYWTTNEDLLCFFVNHKDMHEMGNEINKMLSFARSNTKEEFIASLNLVIYYTTTFNHIMGVSLQNIL